MRKVVMVFVIYFFLIAGWSASFAPWLAEQGITGTLVGQVAATLITALIGGVLGLGATCMMLFIIMPLILKKDKTPSS